MPGHQKIALAGSSEAAAAAAAAGKSDAMKLIWKTQIGDGLDETGI